jgi:hypothetical protein
MKIELSKEQVAPLADTLAVANTPAYLFRHFFNDSNIQALVRSFSAATLLRHSREAADAKPRTLENEARAYAFLIAAGARPIKDYASATSEGAAIPDLRWSKALTDMRNRAAQVSNNTFTLTTSTTQLPTPTTTSSALILPHGRKTAG